MEQESIPAFDHRRWGVGAIIVVGALLVVGLVAFTEGVFHGAAGSQVLGTVCLIGGIAVIAIKLGEDLKPVRVVWGITGEVGVVVNVVGKGTKGTVRVRSELWSAMSESPLSPGTNVRVTKVEGLVAWVKALKGEDGAP